MAAINTTGVISYPVGAAALSRGQRVKLAHGLLVSAGDESFIGYAETDMDASAAIGAFRSVGAPGSKVGIATTAFAVGVTLFTAAGGKVDATGTRIVGIAGSAAQATNAVVTILPVIS